MLVDKPCYSIYIPTEQRLCKSNLSIVCKPNKGVFMHVANSPDQVSPLLKGVKIPNTVLTQMDGTTAFLKDILNKQAAVIIFYRGSW